MAISLKTAGTWARVVADPSSVTIPGTPAAGDRMFLFASWKDFAITVADPNGWTPIVNSFADGAVNAGNGIGSVSVAAWYRDWQSGDTAPSLNWSAAPTEAHAVVMLWQKGASDVWGTPTFATAAIAANDPWSAPASTTLTITDGAVVMSLVAFRDDLTTITRAADDIDDDGSPAVTWNGNYVESPATHYTSTTGLDAAGDLGHRLVTTGAAGVSLTTAGDPSAAETGSALWVHQGLAVTQTVGALDLLDPTSAVYAPTIVPAPVTVGALDLLDPSSAIYELAPAFVVALDLLDPVSAVYAPTITEATQTVGALDLLDPVSAAYAPTIVPGAITVGALDLLDPGSAIYSPTATPTNLLTLSLLDPVSAVYAPTLSTLNVIGLDLLDPVSATYAPIIAVGPVTIGEVSLLDPASAIYQLVVSNATGGTQEIGPGLLDPAAAIYALTITPGPVEVALGLLDPAATIYAPTIVAVSGLALPLLDPSSAIYALAASQGTATVVLELLGNGAVVYALTIGGPVDQRATSGTIASARISGTISRGQIGGTIE